MFLTFHEEFRSPCNAGLQHVYHLALPTCVLQSAARARSVDGTVARGKMADAKNRCETRNVAPVAREFRIYNTQILRPLPILGLLDPRTATDTGACARSFRMPPSAWICVDLTRSKMAGSAVQRPAGARRKRLAQNHHSEGQPFRAAGHWRDHSGQPDYRDGLCGPCRPSTTRPGQAPCFANHQPQGLLRPHNLPPAGLCWTSAPCRMALI